MSKPPARSGLDAAGFIVRDVDIERIQPTYLPVVARLVEVGRAAFGTDLHGLYLYGSVPRGTAVPDGSDLDVLAVLTVRPDSAHRERAGEVAGAVARDFPFVTEVSIVLSAAGEIVSRRQRYDMGFFVKCLCACVAGDDLSRRLPRYRPSRSLARGTNGNIGDVLARARQRLSAADDGEAVRAVCRGTARKIVRTGFTLVMPDEQVWTADLVESARLFAKHYPAQTAAMESALRLALHPSANRAAVEQLIDTLGSWLRQEYATMILAPSRRAMVACLDGDRSAAGREHHVGPEVACSLSPTTG